MRPRPWAMAPPYPPQCTTVLYLFQWTFLCAPTFLYWVDERADRVALRGRLLRLDAAASRAVAPSVGGGEQNRSRTHCRGDRGFGTRRSAGGAVALPAHYRASP